ncbi:hypothetical protein QJS10_CPA07g00089 [Acorus calamus]|uniref:Uncharacterized protein n=1 Tax=Acorus calamus TaxID=4465 RepID=A0AAV9EDJ4_ACOCL|nr:hypothetical protein QJS10_CPA07g00089 [Acorus calamus]
MGGSHDNCWESSPLLNPGRSQLSMKIHDEGLDIQTTRNEDHFGAVVHHLSLIRNKRCLMAYM